MSCRWLSALTIMAPPRHLDELKASSQEAANEPYWIPYRSKQLARREVSLPEPSRMNSALSECGEAAIGLGRLNPRWADERGTIQPESMDTTFWIQ
jgi:hypothetical protein